MNKGYQRSELHGDHFSALGYDAKAAREALVRLLHNGAREADGTPLVRGSKRLTVRSICDPAGAGTGLMALQASTGAGGEAELGSAYPVLGGMANTLIVEQVSPWENGIEAYLRLSTVGGKSFWAFDTHYYRYHASYRPGVRFRFSVSGLALAMRRAVTPQGPSFSAPQLTTVERRDATANASPPGMTLLLAADAVGNYIVQGPALAVSEVLLDGLPLFRVGTTLLFEDGELSLNVYASPAACGGYRPAVGDDVRVLAWLQVRRTFG